MENSSLVWLEAEKTHERITDEDLPHFTFDLDRARACAASDR